MLAPNPTQPLTFADACRLAASQDFGRCRPSFRWHNHTYYLCRRCGGWQPAQRFGAIHSRKSKCGRNSFCRGCAAEAVRASNAKARNPLPVPARIPSGWKFGEHFADAADSVGSIAPDVTLDETLNPDRMGDDPRDIERVRFARARSYNPALTWPEWVALTTRKKPGRKPQPRGATR